MGIGNECDGNGNVIMKMRVHVDGVDVLVEATLILIRIPFLYRRAKTVRNIYKVFKIQIMAQQKLSWHVK